VFEKRRYNKVVKPKSTNLIKKTRNIFKTNEKLILASKTDIQTLFDEYKTSFRGISEKIAQNLQIKHKKNKLNIQKNNSVIKLFLDSFVNPFTIVLFFLATISIFTDALTTKNTKNYTSAVIIMIMIFVSGIIRFIQETRFGKAARKLGEMVNTLITVSRIESGETEIPISEIIVGDIIHLAAGDIIPADVRIIKSKDLFVNQSSLTGEGEPVEKFSENKHKDITSPIECENLAFMGCNVVSGSASCIVILVGDETIFGSIAQSITKKNASKNFEKGLNSVSWLLIKFVIFMVPIVLLINGLTKKNWFDAFLFAISIAVGLTPEMLPMIITTNLAKGAVNMSRKKTIIKNLDSIQDFGAMDVLCTDKTGTLTQNKVVLEYHMNVHGEEDERILTHAFLNSYFQTGLKNLMDVAILDYAKERKIFHIADEYEKIDEIPFDFNRRRMSVVICNKSGKKQMITKGAAEEMISISEYVEYKGEIMNITNEIICEILETVQKLNSNGMRVVAIAQKTNPSSEYFSISDENNMVFMGYLAFLDPPKETTPAALKALKKLGISVKILTGDNDFVTKCICQKVDLEVNNLLLGTEIETLSDIQLSEAVENTNVFAKLTPIQKSRIVNTLKKNGHIVGFMGDGINDSVALKNSDVGVSVDTAVDIAKESANIILLEKNLMILEKAVIEGRKTFGNMIKYIKITISSNFGNMLSVIIASVFLPFLPMLPIQILVLNLIYDVSCISIPWDVMDVKYTKIPRSFSTGSIKKFMIWFGFCSSFVDIITYLVLFFIICPKSCGGFYNDQWSNKTKFTSLFNTGWFIESLCTQTLVTHILRSEKNFSTKNHAPLIVIFITFASMIIGCIIPYTQFGEALKMYPLPRIFFSWMVAIIFIFIIFITALKNIYIKKFKELL
jgi:Mg2+-importing ATPase